MLYLFTGLMGSGKTLNAIKFVNEDEAFKDRPKYYHRIDDLDNDRFGWTELNDDELKNWKSLPSGAVILVDECDHVFPTRNAKAEVPEHIRLLKESRKEGKDFVFITQHPNQMDVFVRRNIGHHTHIERIFGAERSKWFTWPKYADPTDKMERSRAITTQVNFDKKYFGLYKSAEQHTHAKRIPWKVLLMPFLLALSAVSFAGYKFMGWFDEEPIHIEQVQATPVFTDFSPSYHEEKPNPAELDYFQKRTPVVKDIPWSAPIYDEVYEVKSFPRPQCYMWESGSRKGICRCFTQQATPLDVSPDVCHGIVKNGYFQEFVEDVAISDVVERSEPRVAERPAASSTRRSSRQVRVISHVPAQRQQATAIRSHLTGAVVSPQRAYSGS